MTTARRIVIVGGGPAGVGAALAARAQDAAAEIVLVSDEDCEPYEKPPLSKAVLIGKAMPQDAPIAGPGGVAAHRVALKGGARVTSLDRAARVIMTEPGERIGYDALVLATASVNRVLPMFPPGPAVAALHTLPDGRRAVETKAGDTIAADLFVVGAGVSPDDSLAKAAGLTVQDGIIVDEHCRTSDPAIFAAGDCTRIPGPNGPVRLENWRHAQEHGAIAGRNAAGGEAAYNTAPSFWSEQYDMYIQGVGWPVAQPSARISRQIGA